LLLFLMRKIILPFVYRVFAVMPIKNDLVLFADGNRETIPDSMKLIYDQMTERKMDIRTFFHDSRSANSIFSLLHKLRFMSAYARAKYVFISDYYMPIFSCKKREETIVIQLWHGCGAFKKWGYSTLGEKFGVSKEKVERYPIHTNYTYVTVSSEEVREHYAEAFNMKDRLDSILATGISRTDVFYDETFIEQATDKFYKAYPMAEGKKVILYAPTFRGTVKNPQTENPIDLENFYNKLKDDHILVFKLHPFMKCGFEIPEHLSSFAFDVSGTMSIDEMLTLTDICISDYSSLIFEYSLFKKPMVFYPYDYDEYLTWRGFYYDYFSFLPGPIVQDSDQLLEKLITIDRWFDQKRVGDFREKFMSACDGNATERIMSLL